MNLPTNVTRFLGGAKITLMKHSPTILLVVGIGTGVATLITACKATVKIQPKMEEYKKDIQTIKEREYDENQKKKDVTRAYVLTVKDVAKEYALPASLGAVSLASILCSHRILNGRVVGLTAAYTTCKNSFDDYRKRIVDKFGEDADENARFGVEKKTIPDEKDPKKERVVRVPDQVADVSPYACFYDNGSKGWSSDSYSRLVFLIAQQKEANRRLAYRGHVFLNEVYDMLGHPRTSAGAIVGWLLNGEGDGYIDFGFLDGKNEQTRDFVNGIEEAILLDFNVDGVIYDKIS